MQPPTRLSVSFFDKDKTCEHANTPVSPLPRLKAPSCTPQKESTFRWRDQNYYINYGENTDHCPCDRPYTPGQISAVHFSHAYSSPTPLHGNWRMRIAHGFFSGDGDVWAARCGCLLRSGGRCGILKYSRLWILLWRFCGHLVEQRCPGKNSVECFDLEWFLGQTNR